MNSDLVEQGWTDEHWDRITTVVTEEAQRARTAAQFLPVIGPQDRSLVSFSDFRMSNGPNLFAAPASRIETNDVPSHVFTTIAVPVHLTSAEMADPNLEAALLQFRRAANIVARLEDAIVFNDRLLPGSPLGGIGGVPPVYQVSGGGPTPPQQVELGLAPLDLGVGAPTPVWPRQSIGLGALPARAPSQLPQFGDTIVGAIIRAMSKLENAGQNGPFACALSPYLYEAVYTPNANFVAARDRILPILNGPLVRASALPEAADSDPPLAYGIVVSLGGNPVGLRVAVDIGVKYLQATEEPRFLFRVSERIGLRITDPQAIAVLHPGDEREEETDVTEGSNS